MRGVHDLLPAKVPDVDLDGRTADILLPPPDADAVRGVLVLIKHLAEQLLD